MIEESARDDHHAEISTAETIVLPHNNEALTHPTLSGPSRAGGYVIDEASGPDIENCSHCETIERIVSITILTEPHGGVYGFSDLPIEQPQKAFHLKPLEIQG
jgi:hypothetical protein